jgi:hypothetical protein
VSRPRTRWFYARVIVLLGILVVVIAYAAHDVLARRARKAWDHTLSVAVIVIRKGPVDDESVESFRHRGPLLEARLESELHRYKPGAPKPFAFTVYGPVDGTTGEPAVKGDGIVDLASHAWDLRTWTRDVDSRAHVVSGAFDSRIYITVQPPRSEKHLIEGSSEQGGRVGVVTVDLDELTVDFAWSVVAHELFHTLDATEHYDDKGRAMVPDGLVEPDLVPLYPQRFVEIMTRGRPISQTVERTLDVIDELGVGKATAREVGWTP